MNGSPSISARNPGIDLIRGLCILSVILLHINIHFKLGDTFLAELLPKKLFSLVFRSGFYGVIVFFTLSGYLISSSVISKWGSLTAVDVKRFYWYRIARILPLLLILLLVLSALHLAGAEGYAIPPAKTSLPRAILAVLGLHFNWLEIQVGYLPANWDVLWSISIEEAFYLFFPLLCLLLKKEKHFFVLLAALLVASPWARANLHPGNELSDRGYLACIDAIAIGCASAIVAQRLKPGKPLAITFLLLGMVLIGFVLVFRKVVYQLGLADAGLNVTLLALGTGLLILWLHRQHEAGASRRPFLLRWLQSMGACSYEIYLSHMFVVLPGLQLFRRASLPDLWLIPAILILVLGSWLLGLLLARHVSEPLNRRLRARHLPQQAGPG